MADDVRVTNWPSASKEDVAYKLWLATRNIQDSVDAQLKLFHRCWSAANGSPNP